MATLSEKTLRQIEISKSLYLKIKHHCIEEEITMTAFYEQMLSWFFKQHSKNKTNSYLASYRNGKKLSLWLEPRIALKIKTLATKAQVSEARIIFTALIQYTNTIKLD